MKNENMNDEKSKLKEKNNGNVSKLNRDATFAVGYMIATAVYAVIAYLAEKLEAHNLRKSQNDLNNLQNKIFYPHGKFKRD